jgi:hypothetical protein
VLLCLEKFVWLKSVFIIVIFFYIYFSLSSFAKKCYTKGKKRRIRKTRWKRENYCLNVSINWNCWLLQKRKHLFSDFFKFHGWTFSNERLIRIKKCIIIEGLYGNFKFLQLFVFAQNWHSFIQTFSKFSDGVRFLYIYFSSDCELMTNLSISWFNFVCSKFLNKFLYESSSKKLL